MRIDQLLNKLCLVKTRSIAKKACDSNLVKINGKLAKSSSKVMENDLIEFTIYGNYFELKITQIPTGNVAKARAAEYYSLLEKHKIDLDL